MARKKKETIEQDASKLTEWRQTAQKLLNWAAGAEYDDDTFTRNLARLPGVLAQLDAERDTMLAPIIAELEAARAKFAPIEECLISAKNTLTARTESKA